MAKFTRNSPEFRDFSYLLPAWSDVNAHGEAAIKCPFPEHIDKTPSASFNIHKGAFYCMRCERGGSAKDYARLTNQPLRSESTAQSGGAASTKKPGTRSFKILPKLTYGPNLGTVYYYFFHTGRVPAAGVSRTQTKQIRQFVLDEVGGRRWSAPKFWMPYSAALDLAYHRFIETGQNDGTELVRWFDRGNEKPVLIVEGEKCARIALELVGDSHDVLSWAGGSGSVGKTRWHALTKRVVILFPDHDEPGIKSMSTLAKILQDLENTVYITQFVGELGSHDDVEQLVANEDDQSARLASFLANATPFDPRVETRENALDDTAAQALTDRELIYPSSSGLTEALQTLDVEMRYNSVSYELEVTHGDDQWLTFDDIESAYLREQIEKTFAFVQKDQFVPAWFGESKWENTVNAFAYDHSVNPLIAWLESLEKPDETTQKRIAGLQESFNSDLGDMMHECLGAASSPFNTWISLSIPVAVCRRQLHPGESYNLLPVLIGENSTAKSSFLQHLLPPELSSMCSLGFEFGMDILERLHGILGSVIVELSEMAAVEGRELKFRQFVTARDDKCRLKYGRRRTVIPRQYIAIGTEYEHDSLEHRFGRLQLYQPINCDSNVSDQQVIGWLDQHRTRIWSVAWHIAQHKELSALFMALPNSLRESHTELIDDHRDSDPWEYLVWDHLLQMEPESEFDLAELVLRCGLLRHVADFTKRERNRLATILRTLGIQEVRRRIKGGRRRMWRMPDNWLDEFGQV